MGGRQSGKEDKIGTSAVPYYQNPHQKITCFAERDGMGLPGFGPESQAPKARRIPSYPTTPMKSVGIAVALLN